MLGNLGDMTEGWPPFIHKEEVVGKRPNLYPYLWGKSYCKLNSLKPITLSLHNLFPDH
jgi:hypothetical protein